MRIARFEFEGETRVGIVEGDRVREISGSLFDPVETMSTAINLTDVRLLAPVSPTQMFGPGVNFADHLEMASGVTGQTEMLDQPEPWLKPINSIIGPEDAIVIPYDTISGIEYEGECLAIIGSVTRRVDPEEAWNRILGYTCGNDNSERSWQANDGSMWRAKGADTFAPIGPWIDTDFNPRIDGDMIVRVNDTEVDRARTADMHFDFGTLVSYISQHITLQPGDVVWSGTSGHPETLKPGDKVDVEVAGIGILSNPVIEEPIKN